MRCALPSIAVSTLAALTLASQSALGWDFPTQDLWRVEPGLALRQLPGQTAQADCDGETPVPEGALNLQQAINLALCHNPQTRLTWAGVMSQAAQLGQSRAAYLPTVNLNVSRSVDDTRTTASAGNFVTTNNTHVLATGKVAAINWLLLDMGARAANVRQSRYALEAALASHDAAVQTVFANAAQAYYDTWAAQAAFESARQAETGASGTLAAATARVRAGASSGPEVLQARVALAQAALGRARAEGTQRLALGALAAAIGLDARTQLRLAPDPALEPGASDESMTPTDAAALTQHLDDLDALMNRALLDHPSVRAAQAQLAAAQAKHDATVAEGLPSLSASVGRYINGRPNTPLSPGASRETLASLQLTIPLFDGFSRNYRIRDTVSQINARQADLANVKANASLDVWRSFQTLRAEAVAVTESVELLRSAAALLDAARERLRAGAVDIQDVITAERDLANARQERIRALAAWRTSRLKLLASLGRVGFWALDATQSLDPDTRQ